MKIRKISKHISSESCFCAHCKQNLNPVGFEKNNHHCFPWGIRYQCLCEKSCLWTNSIRDPIEFVDHVFEDQPMDHRGYVTGFCNDTFCPLCFKYVIVIKNSIGVGSDGTLSLYHKDRNGYVEIINWDECISSYADGLNVLPFLESGSLANPKDFADVYGCSSKQHNLGIMHRGSLYEYGKGEYAPIYKWIKNNKQLIPKEMIDEFRGLPEKLS